MLLSLKTVVTTTEQALYGRVSSWFSLAQPFPKENFHIETDGPAARHNDTEFSKAGTGSRNGSTYSR